MKLDRNTAPGGRGKYAIVNLRKLEEVLSTVNDPFGRVASELRPAMEILRRRGVLSFGEDGSEDEFFVLKLKDRNAREALLAYAESITLKDQEFAGELIELAGRAGPYSPFVKDPD